MSIDFFEISFVIKSHKFTDVITQFISKRKREGCEIKIHDDSVYGTYYSSEYDEQYSDWEPNNELPITDSITKWILDIMNHGNLVTKEGKKYINKNLRDLEDSIEEYNIMLFKCSPQGENYVTFQMFDGQQEKMLSMGEYGWDSMWHERNKAIAEEIFSKYNFNMEEYARGQSFIGDTFDYLKDKPILLELAEEFGQKMIIDRTSSANSSEKRISFENPEMAFFEERKVEPDEADYKGKIVGMGVVAALYPDDEENLYFGNHGTAYDFASRMIKMKGGKTTKTISVNTDYVVISRQMKNRYGNDNNRASLAYRDYCKSQLWTKESILEADRKRQKKGLQEIRIIFEDSLYNWIKGKFDKMMKR